MKNEILALLEQDSHLTAAKIAVMLGKDEAEVKAAICELENDNAGLKRDKLLLTSLSFNSSDGIMSLNLCSTQDLPFVYST